MVITCTAVGCRERFRRGGPVTFHCFPKDPIQRTLWTIAVRRKRFLPTIYSKLCSKHFTEDCFNREKFGGSWLKPNAVPTLFDYSNNSRTNTLLRRSRKRYVSTEETSSSSSSNLSSFLFPERPASSGKLTNGISMLKSLLTPIERNSSTEQLYVSSARTFPLSTSSKSRGPSLFIFKKSCVPPKVEKEDSSIAQHIKKKDKKYIRYLECIANGKEFDDELSLTSSIRWEAAKQKIDLEKRLEVAQKEKKRLQTVLKNIRQKIRYFRKANTAMKNWLDEESENEDEESENEILCDGQNT